MFELKRLSPQGVEAALARAEHYRLLNEPHEADSICRDVLAVDAENQRALVVLILSLSDRIQEDGMVCVKEARSLLPRLEDPYARVYYEGLVHERQAKAMLRGHMPGSGGIAYEQIEQAMKCFEAAEAIRPAGNNDALLRWNTCVRLLDRFPHLRPQIEERVVHLLE